jgi:hypothetical protein
MGTRNISFKRQTQHDNTTSESVNAGLLASQTLIQNPPTGKGYTDKVAGTQVSTEVQTQADRRT